MLQAATVANWVAWPQNYVAHAEYNRGVPQFLSRSWHSLGFGKARTNKPERKYVLMKTADMMVELVRTHKNAFRPADQRITKANQSRYERRKIRAFLRLGDWLAEA